MSLVNTKNNNNKNIPILSIGVLAQLLGIHQRTLRIYDKEGIVCPKRTGKNRRLYSIDDYTKVQVVNFLMRNLALNLAGVKIVFALLERNNIELCDYLSYLKEIAFIAGFNDRVQEENIVKTSKRGRKRRE